MDLFDSTGYLLNTAARLSKKDLTDRLTEYKITNQQWAVVKLLSQTNGLSQATIADMMNSDRATCGAVIDKLIRKGLIQKSINPEDSRSYIVTLKSDGLKLANELTEYAISSNEKAMNNLSSEEIEQFQMTLKKIIKNLQE